MQGPENGTNKLTRRNAMKFAGAAITGAATIPVAGAGLAQSAEAGSATSQEAEHAPAASRSVPLVHKRAKTDGIELHYVVAGNGPVVLCMHGWPQNHREFLPVVERLSDRFMFIAPDLRGYADSDKPYD